MNWFCRASKEEIKYYNPHKYDEAQSPRTSLAWLIAHAGMIV
jgi:hypothetical protein